MGQLPKRRVRVGIDVGGTFTKAVAVDARNGAILSKSTVPTTHHSERGVSEGIVRALGDVVRQSDIEPGDIELISHSTTQAINALLESDTSKVGIVAMGVGPAKKDVVKRTNLSGLLGEDRNITTCHEFLDTSHMITSEEVAAAIGRLRSEGAEVIVATEAFGVDDPSNEMFVMNVSSKCGIPSTASHELSGVYGLEIRTLTAAVNASVLPRTFQVADYIETAVRQTGIAAPLMIMKGDGGITGMDTFRTKPILTVLSGPAASVAGALLYLRITNGIFVEVGGTSTNICIIKGGKPEIRYVTVNRHPTCIRSMDVRILGVAGGSMVTLEGNRISRVGPRSAHISGLGYSCFADPDDLKDGRIVMVKPKEGDSDEYATVRCKDADYAITTTCAANALGMIEEGDYSHANGEAARVALGLLGRHMGVTFHEAAMSIIQTASFMITKEIAGIMREFKLDKSVRIVGGGGGASVLVPFVAKQMGLQYSRAEHADVISSIGVASSMLQEEIEQTMYEPTPEKIAQMQKKIHAMLVSKGAMPESIMVESKYVPEKALIRVTAVGNVEMDSAETSKSVFTLDEARTRAGEISGMRPDMIDMNYETDHYFVFTGHVTTKKIFSRKTRHHVMVLDRYGRLKLSMENGRILQGGKISLLEDLDEFFESRHSEIAPKIFLLNDLKLVDYSGLTSASKIIDAIRNDMEDSQRAAVLVEM